MRKMRLILSLTSSADDPKFVKNRLQNGVVPELREALKKWGFEVDKGFGLAFDPKVEALHASDEVDPG
jgi:hypothetical protein